MRCSIQLRRKQNTYSTDNDKSSIFDQLNTYLSGRFLVSVALFLIRCGAQIWFSCLHFCHPLSGLNTTFKPPLQNRSGMPYYQQQKDHKLRPDKHFRFNKTCFVKVLRLGKFFNYHAETMPGRSVKFFLCLTTTSRDY